MNLQLLQTNLAALIKSRPLTAGSSPYLDDVAASANLRLVQKISFWWRKVQVEQFCVLTTRMLHADGRFTEYLSRFISTSDHSAFREEVGFQFLDYLLSQDLEPLTRSVAQFEDAIIKKRLGNPVDARIPWNCEPYAVISGLLHNAFSRKGLEEGSYEVSVCSTDKAELFHVWQKGA